MQVGGVTLAIFGMMQDGVDVMEDVPLGDGRVCVADAKLFERPVGNVLAPVGLPELVLFRMETLATLVHTLFALYSLGYCFSLEL